MLSPIGHGSILCMAKSLRAQPLPQENSLRFALAGVNREAHLDGFGQSLYLQERDLPVPAFSGPGPKQSAGKKSVWPVR